MGAPKVSGATIVIGIPSFGMISTWFYQARVSMQFPLVSSSIEKVVLNKPIAEARNEIVEFALNQNASHIFWLDDDVIAPPDAFLKMYTQQKDIINGVYWSKSNPPMPLLFRDHLRGPFYDWHVGDLIEIDAAGMGLTLVKTDVYRKISKELGGPWYSTEYASYPGRDWGATNNTEDLYFYWKAKKVGYKVWADTSIQALHFDKYNNVMYSMPQNAPQANPAWEIKKPGTKLIADLGSGPISSYMEDDGQVVTFDIREECKPDVICDLRRIPVPSDTFDKVYSSHTLEHFPYIGVEAVIKEWARILKVGGELHLIVPNLRWSADRLAKDELVPQDMWVIYGEQDYAKNYHAAGFTPRLLASLVESSGLFSDIQIREGDIHGAAVPQNWNLELKALKIKSNNKQDNITPEDYVAPDMPLTNDMMIRIYPTWNDKQYTEEDIKRQQEHDEALQQAVEKKRALIKELGQWPDSQVTIGTWGTDIPKAQLLPNKEEAVNDAPKPRRVRRKKVAQGIVLGDKEL